MQKDTISLLLNNLQDPASALVKKQAEKVAEFETGVLLYGETGTGKDFWAEFIQLASGSEKMLNLNCGDVPEHLIESEWFGYSRGAFTGADDDHEGRWATAGNGIIFLNQIDLLSINMQSRLLRIIERKKYFPLGSTVEKEIDARFLFSADHNIEEKVRNGKFRSDLYYRISAFSIKIPPLRERKEDIMPLIKFFASEAGTGIKLTKKGEKNLLGHRWDGNIREVKNFVNNISVQKNLIDDSDTEKMTGNSFDPERSFTSEDLTLRELETKYIDHLIKKYGNKSKIAQILGISRKSLYDRIEKYGKD
ncbi:MAG: sigma 54-interacting transcriptional regulator [Acidobacteriota bacterium]